MGGGSRVSATTVMRSLRRCGGALAASEREAARSLFSDGVAPSVLFAALHLVNGLADAMSLLLLMVACTVVGSLLSLITYESGSIVNAVLVHAGWNLATGVILFNGSEQSHYLASYQLTNNQYLWLGGHYAIDASPIAIACYVLVVVLALFLMRRQRSHAHLR